MRKEFVIVADNGKGEVGKEIIKCDFARDEGRMVTFYNYSGLLGTGEAIVGAFSKELVKYYYRTDEEDKEHEDHKENQALEMRRQYF